MLNERGKRATLSLSHANQVIAVDHHEPSSHEKKVSVGYEETKGLTILTPILTENSQAGGSTHLKND